MKKINLKYNNRHDFPYMVRVEIPSGNRWGHRRKKSQQNEPVKSLEEAEAAVALWESRGCTASYFKR